MAFVLLDADVVRVPVVEVGVAPRVGRLGGVAAPAGDRVVETALVRPEGGILTQVSPAEQAPCVALCLRISASVVTSSRMMARPASAAVTPQQQAKSPVQ